MRFFSKTKSIIHISRTRIKVARVVVGRDERVETIQDIAWEESSLSGIFSDIREKIGRDVRIVLGEDLVYVVSFSLSGGVRYTRLAIRQEAQKLIPENLDEVVWDFKNIVAVVGDRRSSISKGVQVMAVSKFFMEHIAPGIAEAGFAVEALEAESCSLARMIQDRNDVSLVVRADGENNLLAVIDHGVVTATERVVVPVSAEHVERTALFARKMFSLDIKTILLSGEASGKLRQSLEEKGFLVELAALDPIVGIARKSDLEGEDEQVLNVDILPRDHVGAQLKPSEKKLTAVFVMIVILGAAIVSGILVYRRDARIRKELASVAQTSVVASQISQIEAPREEVSQDVVSMEETASPDVFWDLSRYSIVILNGSGKKGVAGDLRDVLEQKGFVVAKADNADKDTYTKTVVEIKAGIPEDVRKELLAAVSSAYATEEAYVLEDASENDAMIIIGREKVSQ